MKDRTGQKAIVILLLECDLLHVLDYAIAAMPRVTFIVSDGAKVCGG